MKARTITFLNRFYWPDHAATAQLLTDLAEYLARHAWRVDVIAAAAPYAARSDTLPHAEEHNGVRIRRVRAPRRDRATTAGSMAEYASYSAGAMGLYVRGPASTVTVALTDPPMLGSLVLPAARMKGSRFVHWVQDIHPELTTRVGPVKQTGPVYAGLQTIARYVNRTADLTVTIGPRMRDHLLSGGVPDHRLRVIPNWVDTEQVRPLNATENPLVHELGLAGRFVVLYSGNASRSHPMDAVVHAMRALRTRADVAFLFIGGGPGHGIVRRAAEQDGLTNATFLDYLPRNRIAESHSLAGACLVTEAPTVAGLLYPSKSIGILASGRPLLFVGSDASEVAGMVRAHDCGIVVPAGDGPGLVRAIEMLAADSETAARLGANARRAAVDSFDVRSCCAAWESALSALP